MFYRNRAFCHKAMDDLEMAHADLKVSSDFEELNTRARYLLAVILMDSQEYKEASECLKQSEETVARNCIIID